MTHVLAVDWDQHEARYVLASTSGKKVTVRAASSLRLVDVTEGAGEPQTNFGPSLAARLAEMGARRAKLLVSVPRSSIEMLHFSCPPATDRELPELVANLSMQESSTISEQWVLDYIPTDEDPNSPRQVTAVALSPDESERLQEQCASAGLKPSRMLLRPLASASLFLQSADMPEDVCLLVNRIGYEVDLNIVVQGEVAFSRTARLPEGADASETADRLRAEIRRTLAAAPRDQIGDDPIECVYVFGGPDDHRELLEQISEELATPAKWFDPFQAVETRRLDLPDDRGRFAALLGMLLDEAAGSHLVDFLHPHKPPRQVGRLRAGLIAGGGVTAIAALVAALYVWNSLSSINSDNRELAAQLKKLNDTARRAVSQKNLYDELKAWHDRDVNWLDELRDLSIRFPGPRDAVILRMSLRPSQQGGGVIDVEGLVRDPKVVVMMEQEIRDEYHPRVRSPRITERAVERDYTWFFESSMAVKPRSKELYVSHLPEAEQRAADDAEKQTAADDVAVAAAKGAEGQQGDSP
jgi:Tfp pilus assembly PilM family ATPase